MGQEERHDWDPMESSVLEDQCGAYDEMRERLPVAYSDFLGWSLFRHEDIVAVLADPWTYSNASPFTAIPNGMDPPVHGRFREALIPNFDRETMARFETRAREIASRLLAPVVVGGEVEFIGTFAKPFAFKTLCAFLRWPEEQWERLNDWVRDSLQAAFTRDEKAGKDLADLFSEHVKANLDLHRTARHEGVDATATLLATEVDGVRLDDDQIVSILRNWTAGHGTVAAGLSILAVHLAQDADLQGRLRSDFSLIPSAIEEILRVDGPLVANQRRTNRPVEIRGRAIPAGARLTLMWIAANRDRRAFDDPTAVKVERNIEASLVWGQGIHRCMGAPLARLEMRVAIEELLSRTRRFVLAGDGPSRAVYPSNGLSLLPLRID